jgi:MutS-like protein
VASSRSGSLADQREGSHPEERYRTALQQRTAEVAELTRRARRVEINRLVTFVAGAVTALLRNDLGVPPVLPSVLAAMLAAAFLFLVVRHRALNRALRRAVAAKLLTEVGLHRIARDWVGLARAYEDFGVSDPLLDSMVTDDSHPYIADLDIFGPESVRALFGPTPTLAGTATLEAWLSAPAAPQEVRRRQDIVRTLAEDPDGREALTVEALLVDPIDRLQWSACASWLASPPTFDTDSGTEPGTESGVRLPTWAIHAARLLPAISVPLFVVWLAGVPVPMWTWGGLWAIQTILAWRWGTRLTPSLAAAGRFSKGLRGHHALFAAWETYSTSSSELRAVLRRLGGETGRPASREIRLLERWLDAADSRASMLHSVVAPILMWDVHVSWGLERWRARAGSHLEDWFAALGEGEALSAFAALAYDHPDWCLPDVHDGEAGFDADGLGHPLLPNDVVRTSDVHMDGPGRFLLITGSNMSGKSTLLRSIGLAAVLAQAGSPVCASRASLSRLRTFTSMRIKDSLTGGVSLFMAELLRLKAVVDAAHARPGEPALLYLIDEVLQGTNSEERRISARRIVRHLLASNSIGAVTTHDLTLHADAYLDPASTKVHFRETVDDESDQVLTFDYVLRPGLATSRNALKLLNLVGLGGPEGGRPDGDRVEPVEHPPVPNG